MGGREAILRTFEQCGQAWAARTRRPLRVGRQRRAPPPPSGTYCAPPLAPTALPQLAEKTADVAQDTLVELHRQGQQLENAELGMDQVGGCGDAGADAL